MSISKNTFIQGHFSQVTRPQNMLFQNQANLQEVFKKILDNSISAVSKHPDTHFLKDESNRQILSPNPSSELKTSNTILKPLAPNTTPSVDRSLATVPLELATREITAKSLSFETHQIKTNAAGGNCLFYSLIDALGLDLTHTELRQMIYTYVKENAVQNSPLQEFLISDAREIAADLTSQCEEALKSIENQCIGSDLLFLLNISKHFCLYSLLKSFPDFFKPFIENQALINTINKTLQDKKLSATEKATVILRHSTELTTLLKRIQKRWVKIASMDFSEKSLPKIRQDITQCMIDDMQKVGSFGGQAALYALTCLLNCSIHICGKNPKKQSFQITKTFGTAEAKAFVLLSHNHYEAILDKQLLPNNHLPASGAIEKTILLLSQKPTDELSASILAGLKISASEAVKLLSDAKKLDPKKAEDKTKLAIIKTLAEILGL